MGDSTSEREGSTSQRTPGRRDEEAGVRVERVPVGHTGEIVASCTLQTVGFNGLLQVWDVRSRELVRSITGFERVPTCLAFSADGTTLAAGTQDGQVWVWAVATGKPLQLIELGTRGVRSVAFARDGKRLVTVANGAPVALWDVATEPAGITDVQ